MILATAEGLFIISRTNGDGKGNWNIRAFLQDDLYALKDRHKLQGLVQVFRDEFMMQVQPSAIPIILARSIETAHHYKKFFEDKTQHKKWDARFMWLLSQVKPAHDNV